MPLRVQLDEKLERKFRENAMKKFGYTKGALSKAAQEAIKDWISSKEKAEETFEGDPVQAIDGLLKDIDIDAVKLQHDAQKIWAMKVLENASC
jgi:hypothetical protein